LLSGQVEGLRVLSHYWAYLSIDERVISTWP
jgi:hypothetical protein